MESWQDFFEKLSETVMLNLSSVMLQMQEDMRRVELERKRPGFNYLNLFMLKEGVAMVYESLLFLEDALIQYSELEAIFFDCVESTILKGWCRRVWATFQIYLQEWYHGCKTLEDRILWMTVQTF